MVSFGKKSSLWSVRRGDCGRRSGFEPSPRGAEKSGSGRFRSSPALRCAHPDTDCSPGRGRQAAPRRKRGRNPSLVLMKQTCPQWFVSGTLRELRRLVFHQRRHLILRHVRGIVLRSRRGACIRANRIARMSQSAPVLDATARNVRPDPPGVYRRSRNQHPYGSAEGPLAMWRGDVAQGRWETLTFMAGSRCNGVVAPFVTGGAMDGPLFLAYVKQVLVPRSNTAKSSSWTTFPSTKLTG